MILCSSSENVPHIENSTTASAGSAAAVEKGDAPPPLRPQAGALGTPCRTAWTPARPTVPEGPTSGAGVQRNDFNPSSLTPGTLMSGRQHLPTTFIWRAPRPRRLPARIKSQPPLDGLFTVTCRQAINRVRVADRHGITLSPLGTRNGTRTPHEAPSPRPHTRSCFAGAVWRRRRGRPGT